MCVSKQIALNGNSDEVVTVRPAAEKRPFWETATIEARIEAFKQWAKTAPPDTPNVPADSLRREEWYD
jgi:hypothetical protein